MAAAKTLASQSQQVDAVLKDRKICRDEAGATAELGLTPDSLQLAHQVRSARAPLYASPLCFEQQNTKKMA